MLVEELSHLASWRTVTEMKKEGATEQRGRSRDGDRDEGRGIKRDGRLQCCYLHQTYLLGTLSAMRELWPPECNTHHGWCVFVVSVIVFFVILAETPALLVVSS